VLAYLRQNTLAFIALCVSLFSLGGATAYAVNTVRSTDIVDGQVLTQDLGNNAVTTGKIKDGQVTNPDIANNAVGGGKIADNSVGGADINEATLGQVPGAAKLGGYPATTFTNHIFSVSDKTSACAHNQVSSECGVAFISVPAGHTFDVTVISTVTVNPGPTTMTALVCPAYTGPTCIHEIMDYATFPANAYTNTSATLTGVFGPGQYRFNTAIKIAGVLPNNENAHVTTTVMAHDSDIEYLGLG
jgi:hypothetical protein